MCGRFAFYSPSEAAAALFGVSASVEVQPRYNIAPTQFIAAIRDDENRERELVMLRWGLVPFWAKDPSIGNKMINARAETVAEKPAYRAAYRHRRCIVLADGFYEWHREGDVKTPHFISLASGEPFALAGLWETWTDKESGESLQTTTLITTAANDFMTPLHHRMPVILESNTAGEWLAGSTDLLDDVAAITPALQAWPVDRRVNNARNEGEELVSAVGDILR
ncbi:MAG: SOS response-associated peptidase [Gammaproteobacteria bacterium]|jgi:putative SOS response-associated peptidase YedK|nr:SOS response-associated peptidase [Gammaproteobacteria bacterium]MDH3811180.1 SOS response-associated peptidase [Gammaproteobacteria bacterium]MDH3861728.1 SOS response-associated peptidase [Gammaproteobacteria bacterium]